MFKTIFTTYGLQRIASATASGETIKLTHMSVGDGNGNPVDTVLPGSSALRREVYRHTVNRIYRQNPADPSRFTAELVVPAANGGFVMREVGLFDDTGTLFAIANVPETYKPVSTEGAFGDAVIRLQFVVANADVVTLQVDPNTAIATQAWVVNAISAATIIPGGTTNQILRKKSNADGDTEWADPTAVNVTVDCVEETQTLAAGQTVVILGTVTTVGLAVYIDGIRQRHGTGASEWIPDPSLPNTRIVLGAAAAGGEKIVLAQNEPNSSLNYVRKTGDNMTGPLGMGGKKITGLAAGTANGEAIAQGQAGAKVGDLFAGGAASGLPPVPAASGIAAGTYVGGTVPTVQWFLGSGEANNKLWDIYLNGKTMVFRLLNDLNNVGYDWLKVTRNAVASAKMRFQGSVGINKDPASNQALDVGGNIFADGSISGNGAGAFVTAGTAGLEVRSPVNDTGSAAVIAFHRQGMFAANFGLDTDNQLKFGGWSAGDKYVVWHQGNLYEPDFLKFRGVVSANDINGVTENSVRRVEHSGFSSSLMTWRVGGSAATTQMMVTYQGVIQYRVKVDDNVWTPWWVAYHSGNFQEGNHYVANWRLEQRISDVVGAYQAYTYSRGTIDFAFNARPLNDGTNAYGTWNITAAYANGVAWGNVAGRPLGGSQSGASGWRDLNGVYLQWAQGSWDPANGTQPTQRIYLPISFPNGVLSVQVSTNINGANVGTDDWYQVIAAGNNWVDVQRQSNGGNHEVITSPTVWAIGN